jgi:YD repeat-containing protein
VRTTLLVLTLLVGAVSLSLRADAVSYTYDDAGRLTSVTYPNGTSISYTYDAAGNLTARIVTSAGSSAKKPQPKAKPAEAQKSKRDSRQTAADKTARNQ